MKNMTFARFGKIVLCVVLEVAALFAAYSFGHYNGVFDGVNHRGVPGSVWVPARH